jgi:hypothetical protein
MPWAVGAAPATWGTSLLVPIAVGMLANYESSKLQNAAEKAVMSPEAYQAWQQQLAADQTQSPVGSFAGEGVNFALSGFKPNIKDIPRDIQTAGGLASRALGMGTTTISKDAQQALVNRLVNAGIQGGIAGIQDYSQQQQSNQPFDTKQLVGEIAKQAAMGGIFSDVNRIGEKLGFPVANRVGNQLEQMVSQKTEGNQATIKANQPQTTALSPKEAAAQAKAREEFDIADSDQAPLIPFTATRPSKTEGEVEYVRSKDELDNYLKEKAPGLLKQTYTPEEPGEAKQTVGLDEATLRRMADEHMFGTEDKAGQGGLPPKPWTPPTGHEGEIGPERQLYPPRREMPATTEELNPPEPPPSAEDQARIAELKRFRDQSTPPPALGQEAGQKPLESDDSQEFKKLQARMSGLDLNHPNFEKDYNDILGQMETIKNRNNGYVPGTEPSQTPREQPASITPVPESKEKAAAAKAAGATTKDPEGKVVPLWADWATRLFKAAGLQRNISIEPTTGKLVNSEGVPINGISYLRDGVKEAVAKMTYKQLDTFFHEPGGHIFFHDLLNSPHLQDREAAQHMLDTVDKSPDLVKWTAQELARKKIEGVTPEQAIADPTKMGLPSSKTGRNGAERGVHEEFLAEHAGQYFKQHAGESINGFKDIYKQMLSAAKLRWGNATTEDAYRLLHNRFFKDAPFYETHLKPHGVGAVGGVREAERDKYAPRNQEAGQGSLGGQPTGVRQLDEGYKEQELKYKKLLEESNAAFRLRQEAKERYGQDSPEYMEALAEEGGARKRLIDHGVSLDNYDDQLNPKSAARNQEAGQKPLHNPEEDKRRIDQINTALHEQIRQGIPIDQELVNEREVLSERNKIYTKPPINERVRSIMNLANSNIDEGFPQDQTLYVTARNLQDQHPDVVNAIKSSSSVAEAMDKLGLKRVGGPNQKDERGFEHHYSVHPKDSNLKPWELPDDSFLPKQTPRTQEAGQKPIYTGPEQYKYADKDSYEAPEDKTVTDMKAHARVIGKALFPDESHSQQEILGMHGARAIAKGDEPLASDTIHDLVKSGQLKNNERLPFRRAVTSAYETWKAARPGRQQDEGQEPLKKQTDTPEFKKWFGNSKVVDEHGEPLTVYHGTPTPDIKSFDIARGNHGGNLFGKGVYVTPNPKLASTYAKESIAIKGGVLPLHVKIERPFETDTIKSDDLQNFVSKLNKVTGADFGNQTMIGDNLVYKTAIRNLAPLKFSPRWEGNERVWALDNVNGVRLKNSLGMDFSEALEKMGYDGIKYKTNWRTGFNAPGSKDAYVVFHPEQIKSAIGNRGTFDSSNPDIRYQSGEQEPLREQKDKVSGSGVEGRLFLPTAASIDSLRRSIPGEQGGHIADQFTKLYNEQQAMTGKYENQFSGLVKELSPTQRTNVRQALEATRDQQQDMTSSLRTTKEQQAYTQIRNLLGKMGEERGPEGTDQPVITSNGNKRQFKQDENFFPSLLGKEQADTLRINSPADSSKIEQWHQDWMEHQQANGATEKQAQDRWDDLTSSIRGDLANRKAGGNDSYFNGIRKQEGISLPPSMREADLGKALQSYSHRFGADYSWYKHVESNPEMAASMGYKEDGWGKPLDEDVRQANPSQMGNSKVQDITEHYRGEVGSSVFGRPNARAAEHISTTLILGPGTQIHKLISSIAQGVSLAISNPAEALGVIMKGLTHFNEGYLDAVNAGGTRVSPKTAGDNLKMLLDAHSSIADRLKGLSDLSYKAYTLNGFTDRMLTGNLQIAGEHIIASKIARASTGDAEAGKFLRYYDPDYQVGKSYSPDEVKAMASRFSNTIHGSGDPRTLPGFMTKDTEISAFLHLAHWNISSTNAWMRNAWTPATKGNFAPLLTSLLGATLGGYAIKKMKEGLLDTKTPVPDISEIMASAANKEKGLYGRTYGENADSIAYSALELNSLAGFGGVMTSTLKGLDDVMHKNKFAGMGTIFPLDEVATSTMEHIGNLLSALKNGDIGDNWWDRVLPLTQKALLDWTKQNVQIARVGLVNLEKASGGEIMPQDYARHQQTQKEQDLRRFQMSSGLPYEDQSLMGAVNPYTTLGAQQFHRNMDLKQAVTEQLPPLVHNLIGKYGDKPQVLLDRLDALKKNGYQTVPDPEEKAPEFASYYNYMKMTKGQQEATDRVIDYMKHKIANEAKSGVIP